MSLNSRQKIWLGSVAAALLLALALTAYYQHLRSSQARNLLDRAARELGAEQDHNRRIGKEFIADIQANERFLNQLPIVQEIGKATTGKASVYSLAELKSRLSSVYRLFMQSRANVLGITLVNLAEEGREILRVQRDQGAIEVVPESQLGATDSLELLKLAAALPRGQAYHSQIQLGKNSAGPPLLLALIPAHNSRGEVFAVTILTLDATTLLLELGRPAISKNNSYLTFVTDTRGNYLLHPKPGEAFAHQLRPASASSWARDFTPLKEGLKAVGVNDFESLRAFQGPEGAILFAPPLEIALGNVAKVEVMRVWAGMPMALLEQELAQVVRDRMAYVLSMASIALLAVLSAWLLYRYRTTLNKLHHQEMMNQSIHGLVQQMPTAVAMLDSELRVLVCSERFMVINEIAADIDPIGKGIFDLLPNLPQRCRNAIGRALEGESYFGHEDRFFLTASKEKFFDWECGPWRDEGGAIAGVIVSADDVTEISHKRMAAESELKQFRTTLDFTQESVFMYSPDTLRFFYVNQGACQQTAFNEAELLEMRPHDLLAGYDQASFRELIAPLLRAEQTSLRFEASQKRKDGVEIPVEIFLQFIAPLGETARLVQIGTDITQRKLVQAAQALSEKNFRMLAENQGADAMAILNKDGKVEFYNRAARDMFGTRIYEGAEFGLLIGAKEELDIIQPDGKHKIVEVHSDFANWLDHETTMVIFRDITERKQTEVLLRESQKLEAIGQLTGGLAHDFNNMLGVVIGNLDLIGEKLPADEKVRRQHQLATEAALRAAKVTRSLLAVARKQPMNLEYLNLNSLVVELMPLIQTSVSSAVTLGTQLAKGQISIRVDASGLTNALLNLVINARDAMKGQAGEHRLLVGTRIAAGAEAGLGVADYAVLEVTDNGPGMSQALQQRVFEPFFTTKEVGQGTGLGLSMVRGYCEQLGGAVKLQSELGQGTTVRMYLPLAQQSTSTAMESA